MSSGDHRYAVIVAGGSGTRLWPLSRRNLPKQMQALMSDKSLVVETVDRLQGVIDPGHVLVSTTGNYADQIMELLPQIPRENFIIEPAARGTAAAFALFTHQIHERDPEAVIFSLASDHAISEVGKFHETVEKCFTFIEAQRDHLAFVGITPTRPDTGLGYIKVREEMQADPVIYAAEKFVEKPSHDVAVGYVESGEYYWNAGYYCFVASTLLAAYDDADPRLVEAARAFTMSADPADFMEAPEKVHEIEVIDSSKFPLAVVPANFTWSDIGNWQALHRVLSEVEPGSLVTTKPQQHIDVDSTNCLVFSHDERIIATVGLNNIAIVSTPDVLLAVDMDKLEGLPELFEILRQKNLDQYL